MVSEMDKNLQIKCSNTIRGLAIDAVQAANSGHPGMPMGMADVAFVLWTEFLKHNPDNPDWFDRDRFVLSAGHGSMLLYSLLHLTGYPLPLQELKQFRQWDSKTPGHPEFGLTKGVETTTGPLGQGFANGVGMAIAETHLADKCNTIDLNVIDHHTYAIVSDGDLMEGISHEAASLAGHLGLGKLIYFYDDNGITIDGSTDLAFSENVKQRFEAYGWHCISIDGHDFKAIRNATFEAKAESERPSLILCKTHIGYGSPNKQGTAESHGAPLGDDEIRLTKERLGLDPEQKFQIDEDVKDFFRKAVEKGKQEEEEWNKQVSQLSEDAPEKAAFLDSCINRNIPDIADALPSFEADAKGMATRKASGSVLDSLMQKIPHIIGGSADLTPSNNTKAKGIGIYSAGDRGGRYIHYGVREHGMWGAMNGIALHGGLIPFGGTFLIFSDYCRPSIRLAALSGLPSVGVFTHDSIGLGEDGPTHQPVEQLSSLRAIPNLVLLRPCDANETARAWKVALERTDGPTLIALSRQPIPTLDRKTFASASLVEKGAYVLADAENKDPDIVMIGTGAEVSHLVEARRILSKKNIHARVVSMPSWELFRKQSASYRKSVLLSDDIPKLSMEAGVSHGWSEWTGPNGVSIAIDHFGASAPYKTIFEKFGFTPENAVATAEELLKQ